MSLDPIYTWQPTMCGMCGQPIVYVGPYWQHTGEAQPRHPAVPVEEWERIKAQQSAPETPMRVTFDLDTFMERLSKQQTVSFDDVELLAAVLETVNAERVTLLTLLRQCKPWLPAVERELRAAVARALGEEV